MSFNPWRKSRNSAIVSTVLGLVILVIPYYIIVNRIGVTISGHHFPPIVPALAVSIVSMIMFSIARSKIIRGKKSKYGIDVENAAVSAAISMDWGEYRCWEDGNAYKGVGNIDLFVATRLKKILTIEIKSWHRIKYDNDNLYYKDGNIIKKDPLAQAIRQAKIVERATGQEAAPILWLPKSSGRPVYVRGVFVIRGSANTLKNRITERF